MICGLTILPSAAETLTFDFFLETALQNSYKLKTSKIENKIRNMGLKKLVQDISQLYQAMQQQKDITIYLTGQDK